MRAAADDFTPIEQECIRQAREIEDARGLSDIMFVVELWNAHDRRKRVVDHNAKTLEAYMEHMK